MFCASVSMVTPNSMAPFHGCRLPGFSVCSGLTRWKAQAGGELGRLSEADSTFECLSAHASSCTSARSLSLSPFLSSPSLHLFIYCVCAHVSRSLRVEFRGSQFLQVCALQGSILGCTAWWEALYPTKDLTSPRVWS